MIQRVQLPDGRTAAFPDDATKEEITQAVNQVPESQQQEGGLEQSLRFVNRGISQLFGLPGDLVNLGNRFLSENIPGFEAGRLPIGSQDIESGLRKVGVGVPGERETADDPSEVFGREIGAGISALLPFGAISRGAQSAVQAGRGGAVTRTLAEAAETTGRRPGLTSGLEAASITGAGAGAAGGRAIATEEDDARSLELLGGLAGGLSPAALATVPSTARVGMKAGRAAIDPFTREGATFRAARRAQDLAADPRAAARALEEDDIIEEARGLVPPAQRTGESRLVGLQRSLTDEDPELERIIAQRSELAEQRAREAGEQIGGAPPEAARRFLTQRRNRAIERFQNRASQAVNRAQSRLAQLDPDATPEQQSRIVRDELDRSLSAAQTEENRLWNQVPKETRVLTRETRSAFREIEGQQGRLSDPEDVPNLLKDRIPNVQGRESVRELQDLRSQILRDIRAERAKDAPNRRKIANLERMQEAVLNDMSRAGPGRRGGRQLNEALAFSRVLNQRFRQGPIGRVLGFERAGGPSVPPGETLSRTVGRAREAGGENLDALRRALGGAEESEAAEATMNRIIQAAGTEEGQQAINRFMGATFRAQAVNPDGTVSPSAGRAFLRRNREVLDRLPEARNQIEEAIQSQRAAERTLSQRDRLSRSLQQKSRSRLGLYLDTAPDRAMNRVLSSDDPREAARILRNAAAKDPTGFAQKGLKDEYVQTLMREAETGAVDETGQRMISGRRLRRLIQRDPVEQAGREFLTEQERKRLDQIANTLSRVEAGQDRAPNVGRPLNDLASSMLEIPARIVGAQAGGRIGQGSAGGSLQTAQILSSRVRDFIRNRFRDKAREVLTDAVQDETLFRTLLTQPTQRQREVEVMQRLNAWLGGTATSRQQEVEQAAQ